MDCWGRLTVVDLRRCNPDIIKNKFKIVEIVIELCDLIGMKRYKGCNVVNFGDDEKVAGYSFTQLIQTSLISGHLANATNNAYIDIFSCKDYDSEKSANFLQDSFEAVQMNYTTVDRP